MLRVQELVISLLLVVLLQILQEHGVTSRTKIEKMTFIKPSIGKNGMIYFTLRPANNGNAQATTAANTALPGETEADRNAQSLLNAKRAEHGSQPLRFSAELKALALQCATSYQQYETAQGTIPTLSNLNDCYQRALVNDTAVYFYETTSSQPIAGLTSSINDWYEEVDGADLEYNYENPDESTLSEYEHKTQIIWNSTTTFGSACFATPIGSPTTPAPPPAGVTTPRPRRRYVCSFAFRPGGNVRRRFNAETLDEYKRNVGPPIN